MMKNVTLRQLRIFSTVARQLSFTRAGHCLYLSQPAVSSQIRQLEAALSSRLFHRVGRSVQLTEAGARLLCCVDEIENSLERTEESLAALRGVKMGTLKIGAVNTANYFAASLVNRFSANNPSITVRYTVDATSEILSQLVQGQTDVIIIGFVPPNLNIVSKPFAKHPYVIIASPSHPLARLKRVSLKQLFKERFVSRKQGSSARAIMENLAQGIGVNYDPGMEMTSNETIKQAVMAGIGIGFISRHTLSLELLTGRLAILKVEGFPVIRNWYVISLRDRQLSPVASAFDRYLVTSGAEIIDSIMGNGEPAKGS
ncbi:MAG: LysR family transcriptional regulator [Betaproteobacteria bacterium]|nr:LysR family transcriptional regulator [Betaproteobacteria bacterium]